MPKKVKHRITYIDFDNKAHSRSFPSMQAATDAFNNILQSRPSVARVALWTKDGDLYRVTSSRGFRAWYNLRVEGA